MSEDAKTPEVDLSKVRVETHEERIGRMLDPVLTAMGTPLPKLRQEYFCQLYTSDREFFANGAQSYIEAYNPPKVGNWYQTVRSQASQLLTNINVLKRINELLTAEGLNDEFVDKQLLFVINQNADFSSKVAAMREYNKLKARITDKLDVTTGGEKVGFMVYKPEKLKDPDATN